MLTPEYLQRLPDSVVELYAQAEADILADMARRINGFDLFIPSAQYFLTSIIRLRFIYLFTVRPVSALKIRHR